MSIRVAIAAALIALAGTAANGQTAVGSVFTYQGQLTDAGAPANGSYDLQFKLFDAAASGAQVGPTVTAPAMAVTRGLFTRPLDFGAAAVNGAARWLEIGVKPAGSPVAYTILNPRQAVTPAPYAMGLALPCAETLASGSSLLTLTQNGAGNTFTAYAGGAGTAVYAQSSGGGAAVFGYNLATAGYTGYFRSENVNNTASTLRVEASGGNAGDFQVATAGSYASPVYAQTSGLGTAGTFLNNNAANNSITLYSVTTGGGPAIGGYNSGTGRSGYFVNTSATNSAPALEASTNGTGYAGLFDGNVKVTGDIMTNYGNAATANRAAPIAFGSFSMSTPAAVSGSANVTTAYLSNDTYRVTVAGETNPSAWTCVVNVVYSNPANPDVEFSSIRVGTANAGGQILIYCPCTSGCGTFTAQDFRISFVVYKP
jgi:hypothetical protein